jgi:ribosomal protein L37AE/L43A
MKMNDGVCPRCDGENLDYQSGNLEDTLQYSFEVECKDCGWKGKEWYEMRFCGFTDYDTDEDITDNHAWFKCHACKEGYMRRIPRDTVKGWHCPECQEWTSGTGKAVDEKTKAILTLE